jgi:hypothetical protein
MLPVNKNVKKKNDTLEKKEVKRKIGDKAKTKKRKKKV